MLWSCLEKKGVPFECTWVIRDMYTKVKTKMRILGEDTKDFYVDIGLHQDSALSPFLFVIVIDELTKDDQDEVPWCIFTEDSFLLNGTRNRVNHKLEKWRDTLKSEGFRLSRSKTECLECKFSEGEKETAEEANINNMVIPKVEKFKYH